jgi:hypothetical protein
VRAQAPHHLSTDALDADQLVDGAEGTPPPVDDDLGRLRGTDSGQEAQDLDRGGVEVDDAVDGLAGPRDRRDCDGDQQPDEPRQRTKHARFSTRVENRLSAAVVNHGRQFVGTNGAQKEVVTPTVAESAMLPCRPA